MMVKICGITNRDDALAAIDSGAGALGFNFYKRSPRYISPEMAAQLTSRLPREVLKVGVFANATADFVAAVTMQASLDVAQLHGHCGMPVGIRAWKALAVDAGFDPAELDTWPVEAFLLDAPGGADYGGTGKTFNWRAVAGLPQKIVLAGGLDEHNVAEAIRTARPWAVDVCSRLESSPGRKDHAKMTRFIKAALSAEKS